MRKIFLLLLLVITSSFYLTPLYPVYAQNAQKTLLVEKINTEFKDVNTRRTTQLIDRLNSINEDLNKLEGGLTQLSDKSLDINPVKSDIARSKLFIADAKKQLLAQKDKNYEVKVTSDVKAKAEVKAKRDVLHNDLVKSRNALLNARNSVMDVDHAILELIKND